MCLPLGASTHLLLPAGRLLQAAALGLGGDETGAGDGREQSTAPGDGDREDWHRGTAAAVTASAGFDEGCAAVAAASKAGGEGLYL